MGSYSAAGLKCRASSVIFLPPLRMGLGAIPEGHDAPTIDWQREGCLRAAQLPLIGQGLDVHGHRVVIGVICQDQRQRLAAITLDRDVNVLSGGDEDRQVEASRV